MFSQVMLTMDKVQCSHPGLELFRSCQRRRGAHADDEARSKNLQLCRCVCGYIQELAAGGAAGQCGSR